MDAQTQQAIRIIRILKLSFIVAGALFIFITIRIPSRATTVPGPAFQFMISAIALTAAVAGFLLPKLLAGGRAAEQQTSSVRTPVTAWFFRSVLSLAFFDACNLLAVVLHFVGARTGAVELVFAMGMLSLIFWKPETPPSAEQGVITHY